MKILIVDDEKPNREGLKLLLAQHCPNVQVVGEAESSEQARRLLNEKDVDVLLLDINMPRENGFDLLDSLPHKKFKTIFVTAYAEYAIRAFKANAVDYLLKPIDEEELVAAIQRCSDQLAKPINDEQLISVQEQSMNNVSYDLANKSYPKKLTLPHLYGFQIIAIDQIVYMEADGNYTNIHLLDKMKLVITKGIKEFENLLDPEAFFRVHKSALINLNYVKEYSSIDGQIAVMTNGAKVAISRRRLEEFMKAINHFSKRI